MKTRFTLFSATIFMLMAFSFNAHAQNSVSFNNSLPIQTISNIHPSIGIDYKKPSNETVHIQLRLLTNSGRLIKQWTRTVTSGSNSGSELFWQIRIPLLSGSDRNNNKWHVQMFNSNWTRKLAQVFSDKNRVGRSSEGVSLIITPSRSGTERFYYRTNRKGLHHFQLKLLVNGSVFSEVTNSVTTSGSGQGDFFSRSLSIPTSVNSGNRYILRFEMYDSNWKKLAQESYRLFVPGAVSLQAELPTESDTEEAVFEGVVASPNPFTNSFHYDYNVTQDDVVSVYLYTLNGQIVKTIQNSEEHSPGSYSDYIDASDLNAGVYILRVTSGEGDTSLKLIKN